ncbi:MAG: hypothetical protein ABIJ41_04240 [Candidatus Omnitrophota bacterium]
MINRSYLGIKILSLVALVFFFQRFFVLSLMYIFESKTLIATKAVYGSCGLIAWIFEILYAGFLFCGLLGSLMSFGLKERGRQILILALFGNLVFYGISFLPKVYLVTYDEGVALAVFYFASLLFLTRPKVKENLSLMKR